MDEKEKESGFNIVNAISLIIVVAYLGAIPLWMFQPPIVPPEVLAIINQQMGGLQMAFAAVIGYHIGSSKSSKDAQQATRDTLSTLATTAATTAATAAGTGTGGAAVSAPAAVAANTDATIKNTEALVAETAAGTDEIKTWNDAVAANTKAAFEDYLAKYPNGVRAPDAKVRIASFP